MKAQKHLRLLSLLFPKPWDFHATHVQAKSGHEHTLSPQITGASSAFVHSIDSDEQMIQSEEAFLGLVGYTDRDLIVTESNDK